MKTTFFAKIAAILVAIIFAACSGMSDQITDVAPTYVTNVTNGDFCKMTAEDADLMIEVPATVLGQFSVTEKGSFAPTGNTLSAQVKGSDGEVSTITVTLPAGFTANAEMTVNTKPAALPTKGAYAINKIFTVTVKYTGKGKNDEVISGNETLTCAISHVQYDPSQNLTVVKEIEYVTKDSIIYLPGDTVYLPGETVYLPGQNVYVEVPVEVLRVDTVERLVKVAPREYVRQTASNEKEIIEMANPGTFSINGTPSFVNGKMNWTGSDGQTSTAVLNFASDTEVSASAKVSAKVVKIHPQVYRIDQTITTNVHYTCTNGESGDSTLVSKVSHYQVDPSVPVDVITEYVYVNDTVYVDREVPVEVPVDVIVEVTKTETKEVKIYVPGKELYIYVENGIATVKLDDTTALEASLNLKEKKIEVEKTNLGKVELTNPSGYTFSFSDGQVATITVNATGATVKSIEYDHKDVQSIREGELSLVKLYFKVTFTYDDVKVEDNEVKTTTKERSFILSKAYVQKAKVEEIVPEVIYAPTLDWDLSASATEVSLKCKVAVAASDGSFSKVYSWTAALAGLESYTDDLYLDGQTAEVTDGNFTGQPTDEATEKDSKDGVWHSVKRNLATKDASKWMLENGTLVGPNNNINYYYTSLVCHLPNGEDIKWEVIPETVVDNHTFSNNGVASFTLSDGRNATYWQTLNTGIHHYITIKVTYNGETETLSIPCLESKGNGKYLLTENTCSVNIFTTK